MSLVAGRTLPKRAAMAADACPACGAPEPLALPLRVDPDGQLTLLSCTRCTFIFAAARLDDRARHARTYHLAREAMKDPVRATVNVVGFLTFWAEKLAWPKSLALLDVGCAEGRLLEVARSMGIRAEGIDVSDYYVERWDRARLPATVATAEEFSAGRSGAYDVVVARQVIEHVRDPQSFLNACGSMLAPGGTCLIETGDPSSWQARWQREAWNFWVPKEGVGAHISFINSLAAEFLGRSSGLVLRGSIPQMRYMSLRAYAQKQGRRMFHPISLSKFLLHQSRLSAARCYWYERRAN
jgi:2-polyprenyl-3-methyl-5-hydroxy-6-metoxy-1,4-benzoquinol methylase